MNALSRAKRKVVRRLRRTERRALSIAKHTMNRRRFGRFLRVLGPGLVTGAADDDPSGIATYSQAGAQSGPGLLWVFPLTYPLLLAVQESCARIGAVSGKGLAAIIKERYGKRMLYTAVFLVVSANIVNIGADIGAMVAATQLFFDVPFAFLAVGYAFSSFLLVIFVSYKSYAKFLKWLALSLFAYPLTAFLAEHDWGLVVKSTILPDFHFDFDTVYIIAGMIGTTISPYLFFWDTSEVVEEEIAKRNMAKIGENPKATKRFLRHLRIDNFVGMTLASVTAWFVVVACSFTLFSSGVRDIDTAADAARALEPLVQGFPNAGFVAKLIFSSGIIGLGFLAVPVLAGSSSYAISEAFGWKEGLYRKFHQARGFYAVIVLATLCGLCMNFFGINPIRALVFTAVFNCIAAVPLLSMITKIGNDVSVMGEYKNGPISNFFMRLVFVLMLAVVLVLFAFFFVERF